MSLWRVAGALALTLTALFCLTAAWLSQDKDVYRSSLESSQLILADLQLVGKEAAALKAETGQFPEIDQIEKRIDPMALQRIGPQQWGRARNEWKLSSLISIASPQETCALGEETRLSKDALRYHRLCYWRGEWFEEYVPESREHSVPTSLEDYLASPWQTAAIALLGLGLLSAAYIVVRPWMRRKVQVDAA